MTDITMRTTGTWQAEDRSWLGSAHGTESTETITLDLSTFPANRRPNGYIPSGTALGKLTTQVNGVDVYSPYDNSVSDGAQTLVGFLFSAVEVHPDASNALTGYVGAAMLTHGKVRTANLPWSSGKGAVDANGKADNGQIRYI